MVGQQELAGGRGGLGRARRRRLVASHGWRRGEGGVAVAHPGHMSTLVGVLECPIDALLSRAWPGDLGGKKRWCGGGSMPCRPWAWSAGFRVVATFGREAYLGGFQGWQGTDFAGFDRLDAAGI